MMPTLFNFIKRYWHWLFYLLAIFLFLCAGYRLGADSVQSKWDKAEAKQTAANLAATRQALTDFVAEAMRINGVAGRIEQQTSDLAKNTSTHTVEYRTHEKLVPMPVDCRPDAGRLQHIDAAVADANTAVAGKPDAAMPAN